MQIEPIPSRFKLIEARSLQSIEFFLIRRFLEPHALTEEPLVTWF